VFGWEEQAREVSVRQRDKALALIEKHFPAGTASAVRSKKIAG
jgi:myo-inositol catabolism protein IolH